MLTQTYECVVLCCVDRPPCHLHGAGPGGPRPTLHGTGPGQRGLGAAPELSPQSRLRGRGDGPGERGRDHPRLLPSVGHHRGPPQVPHHLPAGQLGGLWVAVCCVCPCSGAVSSEVPGNV